MSDTNAAVVAVSAPVTAPVPIASDYTPSSDLWQVLRDEVNAISKRIDDGEVLEPADVVQVNQLKKQVDAYLTSFNKAMRDSQADYKLLLSQELSRIGYTKIENYIQQKRAEQTAEQNQRLQEKQSRLQALIGAVLAATTHVKATEMAYALLPAFTQRFPAVCSAAKAKDITNWDPYEAVITSTLQMLDVFFADPYFKGAMILPITSATMQALLAYVRSGDLGCLAPMKTVFENDKTYLQQQELRQTITSKAAALSQITAIINQTTTTEQKLIVIGQIIRIAETL